MDSCVDVLSRFAKLRTASTRLHLSFELVRSAKTARVARCMRYRFYPGMVRVFFLSCRTPCDLLALVERQASLEESVFEPVEDESRGLVFVART